MTDHDADASHDHPHTWLAVWSGLIGFAGFVRENRRRHYAEKNKGKKDDPPKMGAYR